MMTEEPEPAETTYYNQYKCPNYTVIEKHEDYELREYPAGKWIETTYDSRYMNQAMNRMFMKLFGYINGENSCNKKIAMTAPVILIIPNNNDEGGWIPPEKRYKMRFFIPGSTPEPKSADVFVIEITTNKQYYVRQFGGFALFSKSIMPQYKELAKQVKNEDENFILASYNSPFEFKNRRNEIWIEKQNSD